MRRVGMVVLVGLAIGGCSTVGTAVTSKQVEFVKDGQTTSRDLIAQLGQPQATSKTADGQSLLIYDYTKAASTWITPVPYAGPLLGSANVQHQTVAFLVDSNDVVKQHLMTDERMPLDIGLLMRLFRRQAQHRGHAADKPVAAK